jgi:hypothetical protein
MMARGNSKGIRRNKLVDEAISNMKGEPFTASDLLMTFTGSRTPSVREVGARLGALERAGVLISLGQEATLLHRQMAEAAGLTQMGLRKTTLYQQAPPSNEEEE